MEGSQAPQTRPALKGKHPLIGQCNRRPYSGKLKLTWWNSQAFFARKARRHKDKKEHTLKLLRHADGVVIGEAHGTQGAARALALPPKVTALWSHGCPRNEGVGFLFNDSFLEQFVEVGQGDIIHIHDGRAALVRLEGPLGSLDIVAVYMPAGPSPEARELRKCIREKIRLHIRPASEALTIFMGDWNFTREKGDRTDLDNCKISDLDEEAEHKEVQDHLFGPVRG